MLSSIGIFLLTASVEVKEVSGVEPEFSEGLLRLIHEEASSIGDDLVLGVRIIGGVTNTLVVLERSSKTTAVTRREVLLGNQTTEHRRQLRVALAELFPGRIGAEAGTLTSPGPERAERKTPWASITLFSAGLVAIGLSVWLSAEARGTQAEIDRQVFIDSAQRDLADRRDVERGTAVALMAGGSAALLSGAVVLAFD